MSLGGEMHSVQEPLLRYVVEAGWNHLSPDEALRLRRGETGLVLHEVLVAQLQKLSPGEVDVRRAEDLTGKLERMSPTIAGNEQAWEHI